MRPDFLDRYSRLNSPIHRLPAGLKLLLALALVITIILMPVRAWLFGSIAGLLLLVAGLSRVPPRFLARRLLLLEPFVLGVGILMLLQPGGWRVFLVFAARATLCLFTMILLSNTTPFAAMLGVLRRLRAPAMLVTVLALMYRYLFVLVDQTQRMRRARQSRTFVPGRALSWRSLSTLAGQLFVRTSERAERVYAAMCARGWK